MGHEHSEGTQGRGGCCGGRSCCGGSSTATNVVADAAVRLLDECAMFIEGVGDEAYTRESRVISGGTIGKHVRHVLDHYAAIFVGMDMGEEIGYDRRERNVPMEADRGAARAAIMEIKSRLSRGAAEGTGWLSRPVRVRVMVSAEGDEAELGSTAGRELAFATHHAVHHQAMMRAIAAEHGEGGGTGEFGKAPSTLHHERGGGA